MRLTSVLVLAVFTLTACEGPELTAPVASSARAADAIATPVVSRAAARSGVIVCGGGRPSDGALYLVDGRVASLAELQQLRPERVISVEVIKSAAATSLYGSKAGSGAVIILTLDGPRAAAR
jgi:outer membrane receptor protein involved in Fe transport